MKFEKTIRVNIDIDKIIDTMTDEEFIEDFAPENKVETIYWAIRAYLAQLGDEIGEEESRLGLAHFMEIEKEVKKVLKEREEN